jgi:hypothetical protein
MDTPELLVAGYEEGDPPVEQLDLYCAVRRDQLQVVVLDGVAGVRLSVNTAQVENDLIKDSMTDLLGDFRTVPRPGG